MTAELIKVDFSTKEVVCREKDEVIAPTPEAPSSFPSAEKAAGALVDMQIAAEVLFELKKHGESDPAYLEEFQAALERVNEIKEEILPGDNLVALHMAALAAHEREAEENLLQANRMTTDRV